MGRFEREARHHAEKILHYYKHAGIMAHSQANYHSGQLSNLLGRANKSKNDQEDVSLIQGLMESVDPLMREMKQRQTDDFADRRVKE